MSKRETRLLGLACTFIGIVIGFLIAPIKAGTSVSCGNNNIIGQKEECAGKAAKKRIFPTPVSKQHDF